MRLPFSGRRKACHSVTSQSTLEALPSYKSQEIESIASLAQSSPSWSTIIEAYLVRLVGNLVQTQQSPHYPTTTRFDKYLPLNHLLNLLAINER